MALGSIKISYIFVCVFPGIKPGTSGALAKHCNTELTFLTFW